MDENLGEKKLAAVQLIKLALMALAGVILVAIMRPYTPVIIAVVFASFWAVLALWGLAASRFRLAGWKLAQPLVLIGLVVCVATVSSHVNGGFNRSSQHLVVDWILDIYLRPRLVSSSRVFFGAWYNPHRRHSSLAQI